MLVSNFPKSLNAAAPGENYTPTIVDNPEILKNAPTHNPLKLTLSERLEQEIKAQDLNDLGKFDISFTRAEGFKLVDHHPENFKIQIFLGKYLKGHPQTDSPLDEESSLYLDLVAGLVQGAFQQAYLQGVKSSEILQALGYLNVALYKAKSNPQAFAFFIPREVVNQHLKHSARLIAKLPENQVVVHIVFVFSPQKNKKRSTPRDIDDLLKNP